MKQIMYSFVCLLIYTLPLSGQKGPQTLFDYFYFQEETPVIRIDTDLKKLIRKKQKEEYQPSIISFELENGKEMICESKLRARGNIRKRVCFNPPLKLNFKEKDLIKNGFDSLDILKTVMQCRSSSNTAKYTAKERLVYDLYAIIDTLAMRTKFVTFEMYEDGEHKESLNGFLVESEKHYAQRTETVVVESGTLRSAVLQRGHFLKMTFFQYMIGNPDWAIPNKHNVEILQLADKRLVAIPYDFDYSGIVDTDYSIPHESLPIKSVKERIYLVKNVTIQEATATAAYFNSMKNQFYEVIEKALYLSEKDKKATSSYINGFFKVLSSSRRIEREFVK